MNWQRLTLTVQYNLHRNLRIVHLVLLIINSQPYIISEWLRWSEKIEPLGLIIKALMKIYRHLKYEIKILLMRINHWYSWESLQWIITLNLLKCYIFSKIILIAESRLFYLSTSTQSFLNWHVQPSFDWNKINLSRIGKVKNTYNPSAIECFQFIQSTLCFPHSGKVWSI